MGESSAKNLRGEQMTDVIFNGSSARKPVGQASVELVFDNHDHKLSGEYANFTEVSIKRRVDREAQSTFFINGTKCRRKDITDIFLGTGLGARSYSIIEQGMVSRLIESKPEELRVISKRLRASPNIRNVGRKLKVELSGPRKIWRGLKISGRSSSVSYSISSDNRSRQKSTVSSKRKSVRRAQISMRCAGRAWMLS